MRPWSPRVAPSPADAEAQIREMEPEAAQEWCNFVLLRPAGVPSDCTIALQQMRPEAPPGRQAADAQTGRSIWTVANRSAHRTVLRGRARELRVKQFLYDWAPPAFDHPSLWLSPAVSPFVAGHDIAWIGIDYGKRHAAAVQLHRTTVEVAVTEGEFTDHELREVVRGLEVVSPSAHERIDATHFAELCYQRRHDAEAIAVPVGYWAYKRVPATLQTTAMTADELPQGYPGREVAPPASFGYVLDSALVIGDSRSPHEVEYVHQHREEPNWYVRFLVWPSGSEGAPSFPPALDRQACAHREVRIGGTDVHYAYGTEEYGPHEALWKTGRHTVMMLVKPAPGSGSAWYFRLLEEVVSTSAGSG